MLLAERFLQSAILVALGNGHVSAIQLKSLHHSRGALQVSRSMIVKLLQVPASFDRCLDVRRDILHQGGWLGRLRRCWTASRPPIQRRCG